VCVFACVDVDVGALTTSFALFFRPTHSHTHTHPHPYIAMAAPAKANPSSSSSLSPGAGDPDDEVCSICLDLRESGDINTQQELVILRCGHAFHSACIQAWMAKHSTCPLCRIPRNNAPAAKIRPGEALAHPSSASSSSSVDEPEAARARVRRNQVQCPRNPRDPLAPKRPLTAYILFSNAMRPQLQAKDSPVLPFSEIARVLTQEWGALTDDNRQPYVRAAAQEKERYVRECAIFNSRAAMAAGEY